MMRPQLGIIGGMGPLSSAVFCEKIVRNTPAKRDQDHISVILYNDPGIPPRVEHILGKEQVSPAGALVQVALFLERAGVRILAMPCVTAHYYFDEIREQTHIPLLNMIEETGKYLQERQITKAGVLCTEGTIRAGHLEKGLRKYGIEVCYPKHRDQDRVNDLIFNRIKKNGSVSDDVLASVTDSLKKDEAQVVLLACTDLSAIDHQIPFSPECTDMMEIYAKAVVREIRALCI